MSLMNNLKDGILKCLEEDRKFNCTSELCNYIYEKKISLNKIIEIIGSYLTSTDRIQRLKAIDFLYNLVLNIKSNGFTDSEVNYLAEFFIARLTDSYLIPCEITQTIHLLIIKWNINDEHIKKLIIAIKQVEINQQNSEIRFQFYKIIGHILKYKLSIVRSMNSEFVFLFLQSIDGEKDPRCLLLVFDLFVFLNQNLDTKCYEEELFEVVACYFPIMYNPPKEVNKLHITKENLSERLFLCLTCNQRFVPYLLQLLIDKFESPIEEVKIYCFQVLNQILIDGDYKLFAKYQNDFWNIIKFDCLKKSRTNLDLHNYVEQCLKLLTKVYSSDYDLIKKWFKMILNDLEACLFNLELNCYLPSTVTLTILGISYPNYFNTICRLLISNSIHNYNTNNDSKYRIESLQSLFVFSEEIRKDKEFKLNQNQQFTDHKSLLSKISQEKIELLNDYDKLTSIFDYLICFLFNLILKNDTINDDERLNGLITLRNILLLEIEFDNQLIENYLNQLFKLIKKYENSKYLDESSKILEHFSNTKYELVQKIFIPNLLNELNSINFIRLLEFCKLNLDQEKKFINYSLDCLKNSNIDSNLIDAIGNTLKKHIQNNQTKEFINLLCDHLMQPLVDLIFKNLDDKIIQNESTILSLITEICRYLDLDKSKEIQTFIFILFTTETNKNLAATKNCFLNIEIQFNNDSLLFFKLMESILLSLNIQNTDKDELKLVYTKLFNKLIVTKNVEIFQILINLIEICTAKFENTKSIINSLNYLNDNYDNQTLRIRYLLVKFYISILKSFITIGDDQCEFIIKKLIKILIREKNLDICKQTIIGIKYIHEPDLKLIEQNHVKCKSFLNQRFYYLMIPLLIKEYNYLDSEDALNNLILIESEEESKNEYNQLIKQQESNNNQIKKIYSRTDSFVVKMITNIENKIAAEKDTDNQLMNSQSTIQNSPKSNQFDIDPIKKTLQLRKNLISNAISLKINYLPKAMIKIEIKKLQNIILKNYLNLKELDDCDVLVNNQINFLKLILEYNSKLLEDNLLELINFLIKFLNLPQSNMHIKCKILNCLELIAKSNLKPFEIVKLKFDVIRNIKIMLDHKKRLVRYAAVSSISKWIII